MRVGILLLAAVVTMTTLPASACLNELGTTRQGVNVHLYVHSLEDLRNRLTYATPKPWVARSAMEAVDEVRVDPSDENLNDLAVALVRLGRPQKAIMLLQLIEKRSPGGYATASNLGTAYELSGENERALRWIREGIRRNPNSHDGTEWLHVRILEAKLGKTPMVDDSFLGLDAGEALVPMKPERLPAGNDGNPVSPRGLAIALRYQLQERTFFVPPPDPMVARLFYDWGNLEYAVGAVEFADLAYGFALQYGHPQKALIERRRAAIAKIIASAPPKGFGPATDSLPECATCLGPPPPPSEPEERDPFRAH